MKLKFFIFLILAFSASALKLFAEEFAFERRMVYLEALYKSGQFQKYEKFLGDSINADSDPKHLQEYIKLAKESGDSTIEEEGYRQIIQFQPDSLYAIRGLGVSSFYNEDLKTSEEYLKKYNARASGGDYLTNYLLGSIYYQKPDIKESDKYFTEAQKFLKTANKDSLDIEFIKADVEYRLRNYQESDKIYSKMLKEHPDNTDVKLQYAQYLINNDSLSKAGKILSTLPDIDSFDSTLSSAKSNPYKKRIQENTLIAAEILRVRLYMKEKAMKKASLLLEKLRKRYGQNRQVVITQSDFDGEVSNWNSQLHLLNEVQLQSPENTVIKDRIENIEKNYTSYFNVDNTLKISKDTAGGTVYENLIRETLELRISNQVKFGIINTTDLLNTDKILQPDGSDASWHGAEQQTEIFSEFEIPGNETFNNSTLRLSYFLADNYNFVDDSGLGLLYKYYDLWGRNDLELYYRKPYWDIPEAVIAGATRSRVAYGRQLEIIPNLNIYANVGYNNYETTNQSDAADSYTIAANLSYALPKLDLQKKYLGENSTFFLNYAFDSEFFTHSTWNSSASSENSDQNPFQNRAVNTPTISFYNRWNERFESNIYGGYAYDMIKLSDGNQGSGAVAGLRLDYAIIDELKIYFDISNSIAQQQSASISGGLTWDYAQAINSLLKGNYAK